MLSRRELFPAVAALPLTLLPRETASARPFVHIDAERSIIAVHVRVLDGSGADVSAKVHGLFVGLGIAEILCHTDQVWTRVSGWSVELREDAPDAARELYGAIFGTLERVPV